MKKKQYLIIWRVSTIDNKKTALNTISRNIQSDYLLSECHKDDFKTIVENIVNVIKLRKDGKGELAQNTQKLNLNELNNWFVEIIANK